MNKTIGIDRTGHRLRATIDPATFRPLRGRLLVEREPAAVKVGSVLLPDQAQAPAHKGTVRAIGNGVTWVEPGAVVHFSARGRPELQIGSILYNVIAEQDLYGVEQ
jgi:co-chaperonin GroES (HSP10)